MLHKKLISTNMKNIPAPETPDEFFTKQVLQKIRKKISRKINRTGHLNDLALSLVCYRIIKNWEKFEGKKLVTLWAWINRIISTSIFEILRVEAKDNGYSVEYSVLDINQRSKGVLDTENLTWTEKDLVDVEMELGIVKRDMFSVFTEHLVEHLESNKDKRRVLIYLDMKCKGYKMSEIADRLGVADRVVYVLQNKVYDFAATKWKEIRK